MSDDPTRAPLVLITGAPGSGKTTLAGLLQRELGYPLLQRDALKEVLLNGIGATDRGESQRLGAVSWSLLYALLDQIAGRVPVIVESNFSRGRDEPRLTRFLDRAAPIVLHCAADPAVLERRIIARTGSTDRHPGHFDAIAWAELVQRLDDGAYEPLDLACRTMTIDTSSGLAPDVATILDVIKTV